MTTRLEKPIKRRDFMGMAATGAFSAATGVAVIGMLRLPSPSVFPEATRRYKVGEPDTFVPGDVLMSEGRNAFLLREPRGLYAVSAVCTHLGCIVSRSPEGFECPCHGSRFDPDGRVIAGPAPSAPYWLSLHLAPDGQVVVDEATYVKPGTYLQI